MKSEHTQELERLERTKLLGETAKIAWKELEIFFAKGMVIQVSNELELLDVAHALQKDELQKFEDWLAQGYLSRDFDSDAQTWSASDAMVWCVVIKPWILVQSLSENRH